MTHMAIMNVANGANTYLIDRVCLLTSDMLEMRRAVALRSLKRKPKDWTVSLSNKRKKKAKASDRVISQNCSGR